MQSDSESAVGRVPSPASISDAPGPEGQQIPLLPEQTVAPDAADAAAPAPYTGPERRAQGYLIAEILPDSPPVDGHALQFDQRR